MIRRASRIALAAALGVATTAALAIPAHAAQINLFENANANAGGGGFDYRTTPDSTFANNTFDNGNPLNDAISSVFNYGSTARLCTGFDYTGSCMANIPSGGIINLSTGLNNAFSSINF
ncbi:hypothetical protein [Plantactinospora sp. KLBMP9567]|uniref:hypothetical protein n=1 Tax=Plantactinospora sp. KLBMP9567 TaxID=3085900 RepID=UPI002981B008|nr:hypothetical protein [Plantactinospora sp. KLBMP9567]MDW5327205.1 hypothetical protein [Plantactinospora sp. KLBMP9567]